MPASHAPPPDSAPAISEATSLWRDRSFHGITLTQFLGAFNDNLYKQLMLLLAIPVEPGQADQQQVATVVFSLPFVLFSGIAGHLSDKYSKRRVITLAKGAEVLIMGLGMLGFLAFRQSGYTGLLVVLFLMGTHSAFFGPAKYGILPELFAASDLPRANGIVLMTTFLAIIFGMVSAGFLGDMLVSPGEPLIVAAPRLWIGSAICIGIAAIGTWSSFWIRPIPAAQPDLRLQPGSWTVPRTTWQVLVADRPLIAAVCATSVFWLVSGIAAQAVNSFGQVQLQRSLLETSLMTASIGVGIAAGSVVAGRLCHGRANPRVVRWGLWGIFSTLAAMSISWPTASTPPFHHLLGFGGSIPTLALLGASAGLFAIPLQVFIQSRPPENQKGRMIAVMNLANYIAILLSGFVYGIMDYTVNALGWPRSPIFGFMALLILPLLAFYHPRFASSDASRKTP